jgi:nitrate reductase gamma subunit
VKAAKVLALALAGVAVPAPAYAAGLGVEQAIATGAGVLALIAAAGLLVEMLSLRKLASGAAIADNITYAVLATMCLAASVLAGWVARFLPAGVTADQARLGSDLLVLASFVLFGIYFFRVRQAMSRFLGRLAEQEQELVGALDPKRAEEVLREGDGG